MRLGAEVKWRPFVVGNSLYYMSEEALYGRRPRYEVTPDHDAVVDLGYDVDWGKAASEATLVVTLAKWGAPPGSVILLDGWGALDGRWLVASTSRDYFSPLADVKLVQPARALLEPAAEQKTAPVRVPGSATAAAPTPPTARPRRAGSTNAPSKSPSKNYPTCGAAGTTTHRATVRRRLRLLGLCRRVLQGGRLGHGRALEPVRLVSESQARPRKVHIGPLLRRARVRRVRGGARRAVGPRRHESPGLRRPRPARA